MENRNPYAIFGSSPYIAGEKAAGADAEKVFVVENFAPESEVARIEHEPLTGKARLLDKHGKLLKQMLLKAGENGWLTQDRFAEKYYSISPYAYAAGNPVRFIDINGDSINVADQYREQFNQDLINAFGDNASMFSFNESGNLVFKDLSSQTGLTYSVSSTGMLVYNTDSQGSAIIATDGNGNQLGSTTARELMVGAIGNTESMAYGSIVSGRGSGRWFCNKSSANR